MRIPLRLALLLVITAAVLGLLALTPSWTAARAQQPTGSVPTVTGTPSGPVVTVTYPEQINVRAGPHSVNYDAVGVLLPGESAPALGRSPGGEWILIAYAGAPGGVGWIYAPLVSLTPGFLPIVEPPPTATPRTTPTINPTFAAAFGSQLTPTRLPTFTAPAPIQYPTFAPAAGTSSRIPVGFMILALLIFGVLGALISFVRGR